MPKERDISAIGAPADAPMPQLERPPSRLQSATTSARLRNVRTGLLLPEPPPRPRPLGSGVDAAAGVAHGGQQLVARRQRQHVQEETARDDVPEARLQRLQG